ncbi:MAG TPA: phosphatidate cytidylyltransferase [Solirubrobacteraceae bacterium]|jgi:phosphatidate cytidylyltransferase|nr:phosphatidate cytidylyltransferase [Solirubrobacteraceae bacterium]
MASSARTPGGRANRARRAGAGSGAGTRASRGSASSASGGARGPSGSRGSHRRPPRDPLIRRRRPRAQGDGGSQSDLGARLLAAVPAIAVALFLVIEGGLIFTLGLFVLGCFCLHELYGMFERAHPVRLAGFIALAALLIAANYGDQFQVLLVLVAALPLLFGLTMLQPRPSVGGLAVTLLGIYWIGLALAHAVLLRGLPHGLGIVIDVLVGTFLGDTGAYFGGRMFGKRPLAPAISPNKTVEGLLIGMLCTVLGVWIAGRYQEWLPGTHAIVIGIAIALVAPVGDLFESFVKREARTKDSGGLFGAHGGALDRLDAVLFAAVVGYYVWAAYA